MNRHRMSTMQASLRVPRASGDEPAVCSAVRVYQACSPRQRG